MMAIVDSNSVFHGGKWCFPLQKILFSLIKKRCFLIQKRAFHGIFGHAMWFRYLILICFGFLCVFVLFLSFLHHFLIIFCCIMTFFAHLLPPPTLLPPHQKGFVQRHFKRCVAVWQQISENQIPLPIWMVMKRRDLMATPFF